MSAIALIALALSSVVVGQTGIPAPQPAPAAIPENLYRGELVTYPGPWAFQLHRSHIILVNDEQLEALADPDRPVDLSLTFDKREESLRQVCERAKAAGARTLILAFDHFFTQYRPDQKGKERQLTPDQPEYIGRIAAISKFTAGYGLGLELSFLSPLEIGSGYTRETGESGLWMHYRKGLRDPKTGAYSVELWRQQRWSNNKGPVEIQDAGVRVFAFRQKPMHATPYIAVDPADIVEITNTARVEVFEGIRRDSVDYRSVRVRVFGDGMPDGRDRVLVVQQYKTPEMDYFSDGALPYLTGLCDRYADAGVKLNGLYSDEMHIQQDWGYFSHHDNGEFALRYVSPGFQKQFALRYGAEYADFAKYLVYFVHGQEDAENNLSAKRDVMYVPENSPEGVRRAALLRSRYFKTLQNGVVDLFTAAKHHMESRMGYKLEARAHATWAESPTIDKWDTGQAPLQPRQYEYTSNFIWSCTVHQASAACHDYFKWGDYLTGNGNDHAEGGWLDRNYYALMLGASTGILNEVPYSYVAHWGMPGPIAERRMALVEAYGTSGAPHYDMVHNMEHRDVNVLMLYPIDLVATDERFGSWTTQYGYANQVTQAKLLERGAVKDGAIEMAGRRFTTLATLFEPFPEKRLLDMMEALVAGGGHVIWSGPPPLLDADGEPVLPRWSALTGVIWAPTVGDGLIAPGRQVSFLGRFDGLPPMTILTDFLVDRVYPVTPGPGVETAAVSGKDILGAVRTPAGGGSVSFFGFRPRDDQAGSLGYETRYWFELLARLGAYPPTGVFPGLNDNTEYLSRTTPYLVCRFPNGALAVAPHLRDLEECWPGGFARKPEDDAKLLETLTLPSDRVELTGFHVNGHTVTYQGRHGLTFLPNAAKQPVAFAGMDCQQITIDGETTTFADQKTPLIAWAPVDGARQVAGGAVMQLFFSGTTGQLTIPALGLNGAVQLITEGATPGSRGEVFSARVESGFLRFQAQAPQNNRWVYVVPTD